MRIKLSLLLIVILVSSLFLSACNATVPVIEQQNNFTGTIIGVADDHILVKTDDEKLGLEEISVYLSKIIIKEDYQIGEDVKVYYDGTIRESLPVQVDALSITHKVGHKKANTETFINEFTYLTSEHLLTGGNVNYSPLSLYLALSFANSGASGETRGELSNLLGLPQNMIEEQIGILQSNLHKDDENSKLLIANSLWIQEEINGKKINFEEDFLNLAKEKYQAEIFSMNFSSALTGKEMGKWVAQNTNGLLAPEIVTQEGQIATIINTIYFKDKWNSAFIKDYNYKDSFNSANGTKKEVEFMTQFANSNYAEGLGFKKASLGFQGGGSMFFILPDKNVKVENLLNRDKLREIVELKDSSHKVNWSIPKFTINSEFELIPILKKLKVEKAFGDQADFSNMIKDMDILISQIIQGTHITVEESGVEAAAYTAVEFSTTSMPTEEEIKIMRLDRPFIYGITDDKGSIIFIGTYIE